MRTRGREHKLIARLLGFVALVIAGAMCLRMVTLGIAAVAARGPVFFDWQTYANATERLLHGQPLYPPAQLAGPYHLNDVTLTGFAYPPVAAILLLPFGLGSPGLVLFVGGSTAVFLGGIGAILRHELEDLSLGAFAVVLLSLAFFVPFLSAIATGNADLAIAGMYAWCWVARGRRSWVAPAAAIAASIKIFPGVLAIWGMRANGWRALAIAIATGFLLFAISLPIVGLGTWIDYAVALRGAIPICGGLPSVPCFLVPFVGPALAQVAAVGLSGMLVLIALRVRSDVLAFVLVGAAMLAPIGDLWDHYLLIPYIAVIVVVAHAAGGHRRRSLGRPGRQGPPQPPVAKGLGRRSGDRQGNPRA